MAGGAVTGAILVTGAAGGIGRAIAARLAADGHLVIGADRDGEAMAATAAGIGVGARTLDIAEEDQVVTTLAGIAAGPGLGGLVNNAGLHRIGAVMATEAAEWDRIHNVNARGTFLMCREGARHMARAGGGVIVNTVTRLGFGNPFSAVYMASKAAVQALTQCLAIEMARTGVRVNAVAPGHVGPGTGMETAFREKARAMGMDWPAFEAEVQRSIPLGRWCRPADVAGAVAWLMGPDATFVTGETINVTGGFQAYAGAPDPEELEAPHDDA